MKKATLDVRLEQLLESLSADLAQATDAELLEACTDLGIQPGMKGSVAFLGLKGVFFVPYVPGKLAPVSESNVSTHNEDKPNLPRRQ